MLYFRIVLIAAWLIVTGMMINAVATLGADAGMVFVTDFAHAWRAQFNADFLVHVLLVMAWIVYREKSLPRGLMLALPALMGGPYSLAYILVATFTSQGRFNALLLGRRAP